MDTTEEKAMEAEVLERINRGIIMRTGAYLTNDHFLISSGRHAREYVEKRLVTTEPAFTEGLGNIIAQHFAPSPVDSSVRLVGIPRRSRPDAFSMCFGHGSLHAFHTRSC